MRQYILSSFVSKNGGGNKAAVVLDNVGLTERQMQQVAKKNNFSETAFIDISKSFGNKYTVRYFTPSEEVDICGHAALASFNVIRELGYIKDTVAYHLTRAGELKVLLDNNMILIEMKKPELVMQLDKNYILEMTDLVEDSIISSSNGMIDVSSTGLKDIILEVAGLETLKNMNIKRDRMIEICKEFNLIGMHCFT